MFRLKILFNFFYETIHPDEELNCMSLPVQLVIPVQHSAVQHNAIKYKLLMHMLSDGALSAYRSHDYYAKCRYAECHGVGLDRSLHTDVSLSANSKACRHLFLMPLSKQIVYSCLGSEINVKLGVRKRLEVPIFSLFPPPFAQCRCHKTFFCAG